MAYISESLLRNYQHAELSESRSYKFSREYDASITVFLSHSHLDRDLVLGWIEILARLHIKTYVDWQDSSMPRVTSRVTAEQIKRRIKQLDLFLILATTNAMNSKWVPWEIGIADNSKPEGRIAIIPVVGTNGNFTGNEYLQLYPRIDVQDDNLKITNPGEYQSVYLSIWLRGVQLQKLGS